MPSDEQIEVAAEAAYLGMRKRNKPWSMVSAWEKAEWRLATRAALEAAEATTPKERWFGDENGSYETVAEALECAPLCTTIVLSEIVEIAENRWQLVPVTNKDELCPCGKPEGCGDFLGMECQADRDKPWRWGDLPKEWQR